MCVYGEKLMFKMCVYGEMFGIRFTPASDAKIRGFGV